LALLLGGECLLGENWADAKGGEAQADAIPEKFHRAKDLPNSLERSN
jgi:hypothetical protein